MKDILRKKSGGTILIRPLKNSYWDLNDGDEYVHTGKHNRILLWGSDKATDDSVAKVLWDYNVKNRHKIVNKYNEVAFKRFLEYKNTFEQNKEECLNYGEEETFVGLNIKKKKANEKYKKLVQERQNN